MTRITVLSMAIILASSGLLAQRGERGPRGPRGDRDRSESQQQTLKEAIDLSDEQLSNINDLRRANRNEIREIFQSTRENGMQLREEMQKESPDAAAVGQLMIDAQSAPKRAAAKHRELSAALGGVLTDEQSSKLAELGNDPASRMAQMQARRLGLTERPERDGGRGFGRRGPESFGSFRGRGNFGFRGGPGFRGGRGFGGPARGRGFQRPRSPRGRENDREYNRDRGRGGSEGSRRRGRSERSRGFDGPRDYERGSDGPPWMRYRR
jgi:Spy/CpxP family protein refolding chaperone